MTDLVSCRERCCCSLALQQNSRVENRYKREMTHKDSLDDDALSKYVLLAMDLNEHGMTSRLRS